MLDLRSLVVKNGTTQGITTADTLIVGNKVDAQSGQALTVGGTNATGITIGQASITTSFPGPVELTGDVTTVGGTTFTSDATFEGNVTFGNGPSDTVTFAGTTTVIGDIAFNGAGYRVTNMLDPTGPSTQEGATAAWVTAQIAAIPPTAPGAPADSIQFNDGAGGFGGSAALTFDSANATLTITGDANPALVVASAIDGVFLQVTPVQRELAIFDPLTPTDSTVVSPTDVAVGNGTQSGNVSAGSVGVTDNGTTNVLSLTIPAGVATIKSVDGTATAQTLLLDASQIDVNSVKIVNVADGTNPNDAVNLSQLNAVAAIEYDQQLFVSDGADPLVATGAPLLPFASISAAMAAITDASPTKRYAIYVAAGEYTEASALNLKPNVFIVGVARDAVRITAPSYGLDASFTGAGDNRSGISNAIVTGAASFNFTTVTSTAGKLYFRDTIFVSAVTLTGYNNSIVQSQFSGCQIFGVFTVQGVNVGVFNDNICWSDIVLTQSPFGGVPTILTATGGACSGTVTATTTVNDFNRRISVFARSFWMNGAVTIDGPSSYLDYTVDSLPSGGASAPNGGNLVSIDYGANKALSNLVYPTAVNNPIIPASTNATNMGDWSKQWFFSFSYVYLSTGTDLYIGSAGTSATPDSVGRTVFLQPDQYGIASNVNGGVLDLRTANATGTGISGNVDVTTGTSVNGNSGDVTLATGAVSGTGTRGVISLDGREIDANSTKIVNVADGTNPNDAVNFSQLSAIVSGVSAVSATAPLLSSGGATPDISIDTAGANNGDVLTYNGAAWAAAAPSVTAPASPAASIQFNNAGAFGGSDLLVWNGIDVRVNATGLVDQTYVDITGGAITVNQDAAGAFGPAGNGSLTNSALLLADSDAAQNAELSATLGALTFAGGASSSVLTDAAILEIEAASNVNAKITGGATYLLTPSTVEAGFPTSGAITLDFDPSLTPYKQIGALTDDISFANASNPAAARSITVEILGDTVSRNVTSVPAGWTWLGGPAPTVVPANATVILSLACFGASNNDVVASWSYDGSVNVTGVTASAPLASSGGTTPNISLTGVIGVANGGTGQSSLTSGALVVGQGASAVSTLSPGSNGQVLTVVGGAWAAATLPAATDYSVVSITTAVSQGDAVTVAGVAAIATAASSSRVAGIVSATANKVSVLGIVEDCNFEGSLTLAIGDAVYLSASSAGKLTNVAPSASGEVVAELGIITLVNTVAGGAAAADVLWQPKSIVIL